MSREDVVPERREVEAEEPVSVVVESSVVAVRRGVVTEESVSSLSVVVEESGLRQLWGCGILFFSAGAYDDYHRPRWAHATESFLGTLSHVLCIHQVLSFPATLARCGGLAFLIVYLLVNALAGFPILCLELLLGQFTSLNTAQIFRRLCPLSNGLGWTGLAIALLKLLFLLPTLGVFAANAATTVYSHGHGALVNCSTFNRIQDDRCSSAAKIASCRRENASSLVIDGTCVSGEQAEVGITRLMLSYCFIANYYQLDGLPNRFSKDTRGNPKPLLRNMIAIDIDCGYAFSFNSTVLENTTWYQKYKSFGHPFLLRKSISCHKSYWTPLQFDSPEERISDGSEVRLQLFPKAYVTQYLSPYAAGIRYRNFAQELLKDGAFKNITQKLREKRMWLNRIYALRGSIVPVVYEEDSDEDRERKEKRDMKSQDMFWGILAEYCYEEHHFLHGHNHSETQHRNFYVNCMLRIMEHREVFPSTVEYGESVGGAEGEEDKMTFNTNFIIATVILWILVMVPVIQGPKWIAKTVRVTVYLPFVLLCASVCLPPPLPPSYPPFQIVYGVQMPGFGMGVKTLMAPLDWCQLVDPHTWLMAAWQNVLDIPIGCSVLPVLSSYANFHQDTFLHALLISTVSLALSLLASVSYFGIIGIFAEAVAIPIDELYSRTDEETFNILKEIEPIMPTGHFLYAVFCGSMVLLGLGTAWGTFEAIICHLSEHIRPFLKRRPVGRLTIAVVTTALCIIASIPCSSTQGAEFKHNLEALTFLLVVINTSLTVLVVVGFYGLGPWSKNLKLMFRVGIDLECSPSFSKRLWTSPFRFFFLGTWAGFPAAALGLVLWNLFVHGLDTHKGHAGTLQPNELLPGTRLESSEPMRVVDAAFHHIFLPIFGVGYVLCLVVPSVVTGLRMRGRGFRLAAMLAPAKRWGPANPLHRLYFLRDFSRTLRLVATSHSTLGPDEEEIPNLPIDKPLSAPLLSSSTARHFAGT